MTDTDARPLRAGVIESLAFPGMEVQGGGLGGGGGVREAEGVREGERSERGRER